MTRRTEVVVIALAVVLAAVAVWGWLAWAAHRDETGMERVETEEISDSLRRFDPSPPYKRPAAHNLPTEDRGWPADWPTRHEIGLIAWGQHIDHAEVDVLSIAVERRPSGEVVVTNPPEVPVETVPGSGLEALICSYPWDCGEWIGRIRCESTMNPRAVGSAGERGLTQIHPIHRQRIERLGFTWDDMFDPAANLTVAFDIYSEQGARPWSCR